METQGPGALRQNSQQTQHIALQVFVGERIERPIKRNLGGWRQPPAKHAETFHQWITALKMHFSTVSLCMTCSGAAESGPSSQSGHVQPWPHLQSRLKKVLMTQTEATSFSSSKSQNLNLLAFEATSFRC
jgi:hypothetical protein